MSSCRHITPELVYLAKRRVEEARESPACATLIARNNLICSSCGYTGSLSDLALHQHLLNENHFLCVQTAGPTELWCGHCGDYQYSDMFDTIMSKKRKYSRSYQPSRAPVLRGICNMGATCFMNSVLQVLLNNFYVRKAFMYIAEECTYGQIPKPDATEVGSLPNLQDPHTDSSIVSGVDAQVGHGLHHTNDHAQANISNVDSPSIGCVCCELLRLIKEASGPVAATTVESIHTARSNTINNSNSNGNYGDNRNIAEKRPRRDSFDSESRSVAPQSQSQPLAPSNLLYSLWCHADYLAGKDDYVLC